ncbi:hypothetical protein LTR37_006279 [Vermiconidia calcicola]|uniref:Uncharacterized protein n=1 Tax=Vermiconidia calcicola TaxID=1690605 RepID=A0ACC3NIB1_9PEZI|nr:hypothetical protein LTR37_006279 [Vermiconidia calcicola]
MVQKAMHFTPEVLLSAPRRSAGVPNALGTKVLYTTSSYNFQTHSKTSELHVLEVKSGASLVLAKDEEISDLSWLDDEGIAFVCLQSGTNGCTNVCIGDATWTVRPEDAWSKRHYVAGTIDAPAGNLKIVRLQEEGKEFAFVVSARAKKDGCLFNPEKAKKTHSTGRLYDSLYVRHWDTWVGSERNSLWYGKLSENKHGKFQTSKPMNALKGTGLECPIPPFGGADNFDLGRDCIIFVAKDPHLNPALNTKSNVYVVGIESWDRPEGCALRKVPIPGFEGASTSPVVSPDGKKAAFLSMKTNGYEADKNEILVLPDLHAKDLTPQRAFAAKDSNFAGSWDRSPSSITFGAYGESFYVTAEEQGRSRLFMIQAVLTAESEPRRLTAKGYVSDCKPLQDGRIFISGSTVVDNSFYALVDPYVPPKDCGVLDTCITWTNSNSNQGSKFGLDPSQLSFIWTPASNKAVSREIQSVVVKPSTFDSSKKYPVAYLIHGGPQGSWADNWSTRWNPAVFAEQGYIVVAPNVTGSTGYGQKFTDSIRRNWGGDPYQDIVNCFQWVGENLEGADNERAVALGASYGGYMINWIQGHDLGRKFKALVCHDGILSTAGMLATEELYFPLHDLGGTPWFDPGYDASTEGERRNAAQAHRNFDASTLADWRQWDPSERFANWSTPQLVIHSSKDYRITISDGLAAFNVLQARGVESQFLTFPDENHFVLKPENSLLWHKVVLNWCNKHVGLPAFTEEDPETEEFWGGVRREREQVVEMVGLGKPET